MGVNSLARVAWATAFGSMAAYCQPAPPRTPDLAAHWIAFKGKCWGGELGLLSPRSEALELNQGAPWRWEVYWLNTRMTRAVSYEELLQLSADPNAQDFPTVFARRGSWLLVRGLGKRGWGWIQLDPERMEFHSKSESQDWTNTKRGTGPGNMFLQLDDRAGPLHQRPDPRSAVVFDLRKKPWRRYSEHRSYTWRPAGTWVRALEQRDDWVRVMLPSSEVKTPGREEETYTLTVTWDENRSGWARWTRPGPVKGSWDSWLAWVDVGYYD